MIESDRQHGKPARLYQNTKANIVALGLGAGDEGCMAYATDTNEFGTFDGAAWAWSNHALLSSRHYDTVANAPTRGSMIVGSAAPAWDEVAHPGIARHLQTNVNDVVWAQSITMADDTWIGIGVALERIVFDAAGDICVMGADFGVGTLAPNYAFDVHRTGATRAQIGVYSEGDVPAEVIWGVDGDKDRWTWTVRDSGDNYNMRLYNYTLPGWAMVVDALTNDVGIGIAPNQKLTVEGTMSLKEQAAAGADTVAYGQLWVKNTTPCELWFTDDAGTDTQIV